jgi:hypothetical protein
MVEIESHRTLPKKTEIKRYSTILDIQPPETMNSVLHCKDDLRVFHALSGNTPSMTLVPQDISHSSKVQKSLVEKDGVAPEMQTCHSPSPKNVDY